MTLCQLNITIGVYATESGSISGFMKINEKSIGGTIGKIVDKQFAGSSERVCRFVAVGGFGKRLSNGSFTAAKKLLNENKIQLYSRPESYTGDYILSV